MKNRIILSVFLLIVGAAVIAKLPDANAKKKEGEVVSSADRSTSEKLRTDMRKLWEDHITWTRNVVFCIIDGLPGTDQAVNRLLKNQDDIGSVIQQYYGPNAGEKLTDLLYVHITTAADILKATKSDNNTAFDEANKKWAANADQIAEFLSNANPNWKMQDMKTMMEDHLRLLTDEIVARKKKNYEDDVKAYDKTHEQAMEMADALSDGIIKQFPEKFADDRPMGMGK